jgi:hypothetical protein
MLAETLASPDEPSALPDEYAPDRPPVSDPAAT